MKLSKYVRLVRNCGTCIVTNVKDSGVWLGTATALYEAAGLPKMCGTSEIMAVLDIPAKQMEKIHVKEVEFDSVRSVFGMDLSADAGLDIEAKKLRVAAVVGEKVVSALQCKDGELVFYDEGLIAPLQDAMKSDYASIVVRKNASGQRYVVVKDGLDVLAGIMPVAVVNDEYMSQLEVFQALCVEQLYREKERRIRTAEELEENGTYEEVQVGMEEENAAAELHNED